MMIPHLLRFLLAALPIALLIRLAFFDLEWLANVDDIRWFIAKLALGWFVTGLWLVIIGEDKSRMLDKMRLQLSRLWRLEDALEDLRHECDAHMRTQDMQHEAERKELQAKYKAVVAELEQDGIPLPRRQAE